MPKPRARHEPPNQTPRPQKSIERSENDNTYDVDDPPSFNIVPAPQHGHVCQSFIESRGSTPARHDGRYSFRVERKTMNALSRKVVSTLVQQACILLNESNAQLRAIKYPNSLPSGWTGPVGSTLSGESELEWVKINIAEIINNQSECRRLLSRKIIVDTPAKAL